MSTLVVYLDQYHEQSKSCSFIRIPALMVRQAFLQLICAGYNICFGSYCDG